MTKFYIDQHGCAKNQVDGEIIVSKLCGDGFELVQSAEEADFIIINSCGFIESAKKESLDALYNARSLYPKKKIILAGCLAERYANLFKENLPEADGIFGNGDLLKISEYMQGFSKKKNRVSVFPQEDVSCFNRTYFMNFKNSAYVKITEGCSNHCSFCAIPIIRGELRSRPVKDVIAEIKSLLKQGIFEINLIGQDLAAYGTGVADHALFKSTVHSGVKGESSMSQLAQLLDEISKLKGDFWLRLLYIHPDHFNADIIERIKNDSRILAYFDIPFQSGDTEIIRSMNRKGTKESYITLVKKLRKELPECALRTTLMTGFPGETDEAFENSKDFLQKIKPDWSGCFSYSREEDTPAYKFKNRVAKKIANSRAAELEEIQSKITQERLKSRVKKYYDVLIEEVIDGEDDTSFAIGRAWFQAPEVDGAFVVRFDKDDKEALRAVQPGKLVYVMAERVSGVDIDSRFIRKSGE
ncbi:MAG: 30S ribosomal protein S12 methylthiotransferase RimO [Treponema sp.]|nr:30S ribosomal protein S12 methylthiotransferase RimO [Treponema sp.]MCR5613866.1 30S ribosomal protein S12 methylthiotransferase RimO [Treponema sp.]